MEYSVGLPRGVVVPRAMYAHIWVWGSPRDMY